MILSQGLSRGAFTQALPVLTVLAEGTKDGTSSPACYQKATSVLNKKSDLKKPTNELAIFKAVKEHMNRLGLTPDNLLLPCTYVCTLGFSLWSLSHISLNNTLAVCASLHFPANSSGTHFSCKYILISAKISQYIFLIKAQKSWTQDVTSTVCNKCSSKLTTPCGRLKSHPVIL